MPYVGTIVFGAFIILAVGLRGERAIAVARGASRIARSIAARPARTDEEVRLRGPVVDAADRS
jgi:hypothetical protein